MKTPLHDDVPRSDDPDDARVGLILRGLASDRAEEAWTEFLRAYSTLILQVARHFGRDVDQVAECFLFVCECLAQGRFRRLRRFRPEGPARFSTWLWAVARNLCLDWRRREFGRWRLFGSIARLSSLDREIYCRVFENALSLDEALPAVRVLFPGLDQEQLAESCRRVQDALSSRQMWLLGARRPKLESLDGPVPGREAMPRGDVPDSRPDPEALAVRNEERTALVRALGRLSGPERLLIRLRFQQELTLEQVARLTGGGTAQAVDRRIQGVLRRLREEIATDRHGKRPPLVV